MRTTDPITAALALDAINLGDIRESLTTYTGLKWEVHQHFNQKHQVDYIALEMYNADGHVRFNRPLNGSAHDRDVWNVAWFPKNGNMESIARQVTLEEAADKTHTFFGPKRKTLSEEDYASIATDGATILNSIYAYYAWGRIDAGDAPVVVDLAGGRPDTTSTVLWFGYLCVQNNSVNGLRRVSAVKDRWENFVASNGNRVTVI